MAESGICMRAMPLCTIRARADKLILIWYQSIQVCRSSCWVSLMLKWKHICCKEDEMYMHFQWYSHESRRWYASIYIYIYSNWVHVCNSLQRRCLILYIVSKSWSRMSTTQPDTCRAKRHVPFESKCWQVLSIRDEIWEMLWNPEMLWCNLRLWGTKN